MKRFCIFFFFITPAMVMAGGVYWNPVTGQPEPYRPGAPITGLSTSRNRGWDGNGNTEAAVITGLGETGETVREIARLRAELERARIEAADARDARNAALSAGRQGQEALAEAAEEGIPTTPTAAAATSRAGTTPAPPAGAIRLKVTNNRKEAVELVLDGKPTGQGIGPGEEISLELVPPAKLEARYGEVALAGGKLEVTWEIVGLTQPDVAKLVFTVRP